MYLVLFIYGEFYCYLIKAVAGNLFTLKTVVHVQIYYTTSEKCARLFFQVLISENVTAGC